MVHHKEMLMAGTTDVAEVLNWVRQLVEELVEATSKKQGCVSNIVQIPIAEYTAIGGHGI